MLPLFATAPAPLTLGLSRPSLSLSPCLSFLSVKACLFLSRLCPRCLPFFVATASGVCATSAAEVERNRSASVQRLFLLSFFPCGSLHEPQAPCGAHSAQGVFVSFFPVSLSELEVSRFLFASRLVFSSRAKTPLRVPSTEPRSSANESRAA